MAGPAQALQVTLRIGPPMRFRGDVVDCLRLGCPSFAQALLAQVFISAQNCGAQPVPLGTVSAFVPTPALLVVLPAGIDMVVAVPTAVSGCLRAASFAAGAGYA